MRNKPKWYSILLLGIVLLLASSVLGCQAPPVIVEFSAVPSEIESGESATLLWSVTEATAVTIDQGIGDVSAVGTQTVSPTTTTAYTLTASNADYNVTRSAVVTVTPASLSPTSFTTYKNETCRYTINYPSNWDIMTDNYVNVTETGIISYATMIVGPSPEFRHIIIRVAEYPHPITFETLEELVQVFLEGFPTLNSTRMQGKWDWCLSQNFLDENELRREETYFKLAERRIYMVTVSSGIETYDAPLWSEILETFTLLPESAAYLTYTNDMLGYAISYPNDWLVEVLESNIVRIDPPFPYDGAIHIVAYDKSLPIGVRVQIFVESKAETWDNFTLLDSREMQGMWDWYVSYDYDYTWEEYGTHFHGEAYFKRTEQYTYIVQIDFEKAAYDAYPVSEIVETFMLLPESASYVTYRNDMWGYTISYPNDWLVEVLESNVTRIQPPFPYIGCVDIGANEYSLFPPIRDRAQIWLELLAEKKENLTVLDSRQTEGMWDWYFCYDYYSEEYDREFHGEMYFKDTAQYIYLVQIDFEKAAYDAYPVSEIVETFMLLPE